MSVISYLLLISPLKVPHCLHWILNSHSLGMSLDITNAFIHCTTCPCCVINTATKMRTIVRKVSIINLPFVLKFPCRMPWHVLKRSSCITLCTRRRCWQHWVPAGCQTPNCSHSAQRKQQKKRIVRRWGFGFGFFV